MKSTVAFLFLFLGVCLALKWDPSARRDTKKMSAVNAKRAPHNDDLVSRINKKTTLFKVGCFVVLVCCMDREMLVFV
jgi:hypothetical protein